MKNSITILCALLCTIIIMGNNYAQQPYYPVYTAKENIPFGLQLPLKGINEYRKTDVVESKKEMFQIPQVYFDTVNKKYAVKGYIQFTEKYSSAASTNQYNSKNENLKAGSLGFHLTNDINAATRSSIPNNTTANGPQYAILNGIMYFAADDGMHSMELWRSDGTEAGTFMVKDIEPGLDASDVSGITACNGLLYFTAKTKEYGQEPWVSDGTEAGTHLLKDIIPGNMGSGPNQFIECNGSVLFVITIYNNNDQLWKTDGTELGTGLLFDNYQSGNNIYQLTKVNKDVFFIANSWYNGFQLYKTNGELYGTKMVKQIGYYLGSMQAPLQLTAYNEKLYFSVDEGYGRMLWSSDGSWEGTNPVKGANNIFLVQDYLTFFNNNPFIILNNTLFLSGRNYMDGAGLYKYDASNDNGIVLVKDLTPLNWETDFIVPIDMRLVNDAIYMKVISSITGWHDELWVSKGEEYNTDLVKNFNGTGNMYLPTSAFGKYYFIKNDPVSGSEVWTSNGTEEGTILLKDIYQGINSSNPFFLTAFNDKLYFSAEDPQLGNELWMTDGTLNGTAIVKDINSFSGDSKAGSAYKGISRQGNGVVFNAITNELGAELYFSDGTTDGTKLLNDIAKDGNWAYPNSFINKNDLNYFIGDDEVGTAIYRTNGTQASLRRMIPYIDRDIYYVTNINIMDNGLVLYILGNKNTGQRELWRSDSTKAGTYVINKSLNWDTYTIVIGNTAYFIAGDYEHGYELWKTDGTFLGTKMVRDINIGYNGSYPYSLFAFRKELYFGAWDGGMNSSLWKSDGSERGTVKLKNVTPAYYDYGMNWAKQVFCISNGTLFFSATDLNSIGGELWKTNGTEAGTKLVIDINPKGSANPANLTDVGGILYFTADDGIHGNEIWSTNGNVNSTHLLKDIHEGSAFTDYNNFTDVNGMLYFVDNSNYPNSLWSSDGTEINTKWVEDEGLAGLSDIMGLTSVGNKLFFGAISFQYGAELFVGEVATNGIKFRSVDQEEKLIGNTNAYKIFPNPVVDVLSIEMNMQKAGNVNLSVFDMNGRMYVQKTINANDGFNKSTILLNNLSAGVYLLKIDDSDSRVIKFIKQ